MKVAYVHVLPLEYYPPATNLLELMAGRPSWNVRAWSTKNQRAMPEWRSRHVNVSRNAHPDRQVALPLRLPGYLAWHWRAAREIAQWNPDVIMSVEPHSALATWAYFRVFRGTAALFIHHHEYYAPEDFLAPGMRVLRATVGIERRDLFPRAAWVSQTNPERLRLLRSWNTGIRDSAAGVFPNYPPGDWIDIARRATRPPATQQMRLIYVGSASFEDAFIREICVWTAERPEAASLHVCGNNVDPVVWEWIRSLNAGNITTDQNGVPYNHLPGLLSQFDVGLVLYKGNTVNFVQNIPNKAIEYLACGLEVWYPRQMEGMRRFHRDHEGLRMREMNFTSLSPAVQPSPHSEGEPVPFPFTAESASAPLLDRMEDAVRVAAR